jgi:hypothetical protein
MSDLWPRVDRLIDACLATSDERTQIAQGIGLLAAQRLCDTGQPLPPALERERELATFLHLAGMSLLRRIRDRLDGPMIVIKGPEVAAHYPHPTLRAYGDIDILVPDAAAAQARLLAAGFVETADYEVAHTERPLRWSAFPLAIELHRTLPWLPALREPPLEDAFARAIPSRTGISGVQTLPEADHALLVASHAWRHVPLNRLGDLVDVMAMADGQDPATLAARAEEIRFGPVWATTRATAEALLDDAASGTLCLPWWARHLFPPRDRTVFEVHTARWAGTIHSPTLSGKLQSAGTILREDVWPRRGEPWGDKIARISVALRERHASSFLRRHTS